MGTPKGKEIKTIKNLTPILLRQKRGGGRRGRENNEHDEDTTTYYSLFIIHLHEQQVWSHGCVIKR